MDHEGREPRSSIGPREARPDGTVARIQSLSKEKLTLFYNDVCRDTITDFRCMEMMLGVVAADGLVRLS